MAEFEHKKPELWQTSQGKLRPARPTPEKEGRDHQTGYEAGFREHDRPRESGRLESSFGQISVGSSRKKELTVVLSKRRRQEGPAVTGDEKILKADSARHLKTAKGQFFTNADGRERSAVAYRTGHQKPPAHLAARFRELLEKHGRETLRDQAPFLDREPEQRELQHLTQQARTLREHREDILLRRTEARKDTLRRTLTEKDQQERQLLSLLRSAQAESRLRAGEAWELPVPELTEELPEPPPEDGGDAEKQE